MRPLAFLAVVAALVFASCTTDNPTSGDTTPLMKKKAHAIEWTLGGPVQFLHLGDGDCVYTNQLSSGEGYELSHLGLSSGGGELCMSPTGPGTGSYTSNSIVIVAANGDELHMSIAGEYAPTSETVLGHEGTWMITGGTGRFDDATGSGTYTGTHDLPTMYYEMVLVGTLSY